MIVDKLAAFASDLREAISNREQRSGKTGKRGPQPVWFENKGRDYPAECATAQHLMHQVGDRVIIIQEADTVKDAFSRSDAQWSPSLTAYLGKGAVVERVHAHSVRVQHDDGQRIWWAHGAVSGVDRRKRTVATTKSNFMRMSIKVMAFHALADAAGAWVTRPIMNCCRQISSRIVRGIAAPLFCRPREAELSRARAPVRFMHHELWDEALFLHFPVDSELLQARLPAGLEVDLHQGHAWISFVALTELGISPSFSVLPQALQRLMRLGHHAVNVRTCESHMAPANLLAPSCCPVAVRTVYHTNLCVAHGHCESRDNFHSISSDFLLPCGF
jgi:hypothetical protein